MCLAVLTETFGTMTADLLVLREWLQAMASPTCDGEHRRLLPARVRGAGSREGEG
jgi:hypothetical protein